MDFNLIEKYLNGTAAPDEAQKVLAWFRTEEGQHYLAHRFELDLEQMDEVETTFSRSGNASRTLDRIEARLGRRPIRIHRLTRKSSILAVAACILLLIGLIPLLDSLIGITERQSDQPVSIMIHTTGYGEQKIIQMSDGSSIRLHENSRLEMPEQFARGGREVRLQGQAYFRIAHDRDRPFSVYAGDARVRVLGTAFNVKEASRLGKIQVTVSEGLVSLESGIGEKVEPILLERNMIGLFDMGTRRMESEQVDVNNYLSWIYGRVTYDRTPFREVIRQLERIYEISSDVMDEELYDLRLTADFSERSMMNVLEVIAHSLEIEFSIRGDRVEWRRTQSVPA